MSETMTGGCQCGRIRYAAKVTDQDAYLCHCRMCQRATGGVSIALKSVPVAAVTWTTRQPDRYRSSPIAHRGFCSACGTPLTFEFSDGEAKNLDLTVGSFDDPSRLRPTHHFAVESRHEAWLDTRGLPETRSEDNPSTRDRWMTIVGKLPTETRFIDSWDGTRLAWREMGPRDDGAPTALLLHGFLSDAQTNWIRYGHAAAIAARGIWVVMPDLRGHGESDKPHDPAAYPPDALTRDGHALVVALRLEGYDLVGYSLGARTASRMLATGAQPRRVVFSGMGLEGLTDTGRRAGHFRHLLTNLGKHERGSPAWLAEAFLRTTRGDPLALLGVIDTFADTPADVLAGFAWPTGVVCGAEDRDNGSAPALADALPNARYIEVPGGHMSAVAKPELGEAIAAFLAG